MDKYNTIQNNTIIMHVLNANDCIACQTMSLWKLLANKALDID